MGFVRLGARLVGFLMIALKIDGIVGFGLFIPSFFAVWLRRKSALIAQPLLPREKGGKNLKVPLPGPMALG
jgi:hypothetical protein